MASDPVPCGGWWLGLPPNTRGILLINCKFIQRAASKCPQGIPQNHGCLQTAANANAGPTIHRVQDNIADGPLNSALGTPARLLPPTPRALTDPLLNLEAFIDAARGSQVTIGEIKPIACAAMAAQGKKIWVALVRRDNEAVVNLLQRLQICWDPAAGLFLTSYGYSLCL